MKMIKKLNKMLGLGLAVGLLFYSAAGAKAAQSFDPVMYIQLNNNTTETLTFSNFPEGIDPDSSGTFYLNTGTALTPLNADSQFQVYSGQSIEIEYGQHQHATGVDTFTVSTEKGCNESFGVMPYPSNGVLMYEVISYGELSGSSCGKISGLGVESTSPSFNLVFSGS